MSRRSLSILIAGIAALSALLPAGREARAEQVGSFSKTRDLNFGAFVAGAGIGTVVVSPTGERTQSGVILLNLSSATSAAFSAMVVTIGNNNKGNLKSVSFSLPSSIQLTNGSSSMTVDTFVSSPVAGARSPISLGATVTVSVGATLRVSPNQPSGNYSGSFTVIADFQ
jgi:hypothetical protein